MFCTITSGALVGVSAYLVGVEVDIDRGLPSFNMVGLLGSEVRESRERVCVALKNAGLDIPPSHITVNLSPADRRKEGTAFDLPIAVGVLKALGYFPDADLENTLFLGEMGLDGEIKRVRGVLPIVREAAARGVRQCIIPWANAPEGAVIPGITVRGVCNIRELIAFLSDMESGDTILPATKVDVKRLFGGERELQGLDFAEVGGQESAKRAALIAAAGFHNLLMFGPPGAGKSMIARRIPGILPELTLEESLEVTSIVSVAGQMKEGQALVTDRPFQSPHHTISQTALIGGTAIPKPGMISLAHRGVLFLDELPEFQRPILDSMRQPLEEHQVHISRSGGTITYPANFMLVAAMNPCPCGFYPDKNKCRCTEIQVKKYMSKVSGPILDRIDLCVELQRVDVSKLHGGYGSKLQRRHAAMPRSGNESQLHQGKRRKTITTEPVSSEQMRAMVTAARKAQEKRFIGTKYRFNADIEAADMERFCGLGQEEQEFMEELYGSLQLSARAYHRILKVARTIADLEGAEEISTEHLLEAACYRQTQDV